MARSWSAPAWLSASSDYAMAADGLETSGGSSVQMFASKNARESGIGFGRPCQTVFGRDEDDSDETVPDMLEFEDNNSLVERQSSLSAVYRRSSLVMRHTERSTAFKRVSLSSLRMRSMQATFEYTFSDADSIDDFEDVPSLPSTDDVLGHSGVPDTAMLYENTAQPNRSPSRINSANSHSMLCRDAAPEQQELGGEVGKDENQSAILLEDIVHQVDQLPQSAAEDSAMLHEDIACQRSQPPQEEAESYHASASKSTKVHTASVVAGPASIRKALSAHGSLSGAYPPNTGMEELCVKLPGYGSQYSPMSPATAQPHRSWTSARWRGRETKATQD